VKLGAAALAAVGLCAIASLARAQEIVDLPTRPGVTQSYFLARAPREPRAVAVLFPGAGGHLHLRSEGGRPRFEQGNFLVRSRLEFINRDVVAAIIEAPSDQKKGWGMTDEFRLGEAHFTDVSAVVADLRARFPDLPVFLVGTSRGSVSAAALGARFGPQISGVVLTSALFRATGPRSAEPGPGLSRFDFAAIKAPVLFVHHREDRCAVTPYGDAKALAGTYPLISVSGGKPATSVACEAFSAHGYLGKEPETVEEIVHWMLKRPFKSEVQ